MVYVQEVSFQKAAWDNPNVKCLLLKLDQDLFPVDALLHELKTLYVTANLVYDGDILAGLLICRAFKSYQGALCLEIDHMVAADSISRPLGSMLKENDRLWRWAAQAGFDKIFQHTHTPALARALKSVYGDAKEYIFSKDIRQLKGVENG